MPRIIPVLDVMNGRAVRAIGGRREDYRPLRSSLRPGSDPCAIAAAIRDWFGPCELYLADLDAIAGAPPALELYRALADLGLATWIDTGVRHHSTVPDLLNAGIARVVVGLETIADASDLRSIVDVARPDRVAFSLDLRDGVPIVAPGSRWATDDPSRIAREAVDAGFEAIIVLDLARVGAREGAGPLDLLSELSREHARVEWIAGGGVRDRTDIVRLGEAGASAVLVGSAIHDGRIASHLAEPAADR
jgi:phosphoribosylformimino-5-aminoimidazole carboxamide ribotide isomerase